jgi:hypothetical protein
MATGELSEQKLIKNQENHITNAETCPTEKHKPKKVCNPRQHSNPCKGPTILGVCWGFKDHKKLGSTHIQKSPTLPTKSWNQLTR